MINDKLLKFIKNDVVTGFNNIPKQRKETLDKLADYIQNHLSDREVNLIFICVHNSRRSHLSQFWAQVAAHHYGFKNVICYSGGTEVTEMFPAAVEALKQAGADVRAISHGENPIYTLKYARNVRPVIGFSKVFDDTYNPEKNFAAIMVCSTADKNCPYIANATERILIPFEDPKEFDGTDQQSDKYFERSQQIAIELFYVFSKVKS